MRNDLKNAEALEMIQAGMERYQLLNYGKCLLNCGDIAAICESLAQGRDILLKSRGNYAELVETGRAAAAGENVSWLSRAAAPQNEYQLKGWQREIMEQDQARTGYAWGNAV